MEQEQKHYYAFISYKREDKKEAKRLQHTLEYYRLPNKLRKENPNLPEYVRPIFRDMTDLEVGELSAQIHDALDQSHFLIVVCSPRSAKSQWVNDEIEYFISLGKQDKIIPYIIEGLPHAKNPDEECYPPALLELSKEKELLGANINEVGKDSAAIRVVSRMFNIRFDTLYQRYQRELRKRKRIIAASIFVFFSFIMGIAVILRQKNIELENLNWSMMSNQTRAVSAKANELIDKGDLLTAIKILNEVIPNDDNKRPFIPEAEATFRRAIDSLNIAGYKSLYFLKAHAAPIQSLCLSRSGKLLATGDQKGEIKVWNVMNADFSLKCTLRAHDNEISCLKFSNDGTKILSGSKDRKAILWDIETGNVLKVFNENEWINDISFYKAEKEVVIASGKVHFWSIEKGVIVDSIVTGGNYLINSFDISKDEKRILIASGDSSLSAYSIENHQLLNKIKANDGCLHNCHWSSDENEIVAVVSPSYIWNKKGKWMLAGKPYFCVIDGFTFKISRKEYGQFKDVIQEAHFCNYDKAIITTSNDGSVIIWSLETNSKQIILDENNQPISDAIILETGEIVCTFGADLCILNEKQFINPTFFELNHKDIESITFSKDFSLAATNGFYETKIWSLPEWKLYGTINIGEYHQPCSAFSNDNQYIAITPAADSTIVIFDLTTGNFKTLYGHHWTVSSLDFSPDDKCLVSGSLDSCVIVWDLQNEKIHQHIKRHTGYVYSVRYNHSGKFFATASRDREVHLWNTKTNEMIPFCDHKGHVYDIAFSHNDKYLASVDDNNNVIIRNLESGSILWSAFYGKYGLHHVEFSPDDKLLLCSCQNETYIIDIESGGGVYMIHKDGINADSHFNNDSNNLIFLYTDNINNDAIIEYPFFPIQMLLDSVSHYVNLPQLSDEERRKYYLE